MTAGGKTRVVAVGLGATGIVMAEVLAERTDIHLVGALDVRPELLGRSFASVAVGAPDVAIAAAVTDLPEADVALVATTSWVDSLEPLVASLLSRGMHVVSICEELRDPRVSHPDVVARLDRLAREHGVTVLGTGCNPGMLMDTLPVVLSGLTVGVERVAVRRTADMSRYGAILSKFGLGLDPDEFDARRHAGQVMGHVGFAQSIAAVACGLEWSLDRIEVDPVDRDLIASAERHGAHIVVPAGSVTSVVHRARGWRGDEVVIEFETRFGIFDPADEIERGDTLTIVGREQTVEVVARNGYDSFLSTVAMACNTVAAVTQAEPGFRTLLDLPVGSLASKGARSTGSTDRR